MGLLDSLFWTISCVCYFTLHKILVCVMIVKSQVILKRLYIHWEKPQPNHFQPRYFDTKVKSVRPARVDNLLYYETQAATKIATTFLSCIKELYFGTLLWHVKFSWMRSALFAWRADPRSQKVSFYKGLIIEN